VGVQWCDACIAVVWELALRYCYNGSGHFASSHTMVHFCWMSWILPCPAARPGWSPPGWPFSFFTRNGNYGVTRVCTVMHGWQLVATESFDWPTLASLHQLNTETSVTEWALHYTTQIHQKETACMYTGIIVCQTGWHWWHEWRGSYVVTTWLCVLGPWHDLQFIVQRRRL